MAWDVVFGLASLAVLPGRLVLIAAPRGIGWLEVIPRLVIPLCLSLLYSGLVMAYLYRSGGGFGSIEQVRQMFASDPVLVAGWPHYLAFDLLIGCFAAARLDQAGLSRLVQAPILVTILLLGPLGLLVSLVTEAGAWGFRRHASTDGGFK